MRPLIEVLRWIGPRTAAAVTLLVALELGLYHLGDYGKWIVQEQSARYGWRMLPNQSGWSRDFDVREESNDAGFRDDRDWGRPREQPGVLRLAVVGNSMTYGTSVPVADTWPRVLEDLLDAELERRGDPRDALVMNFATQGYTFEQMARLYEDVIAPWRPDHLLWPTIAADTRPMRPAVDDADYAFRRHVMRTATYDFLRDRVIDRWIPPPAASAPEPTPRAVKRAWRERLVPAVRAALAAAPGAEDGADGPLARAVGEALDRGLERAPLDRVVRAVWSELQRPELAALAAREGVDLAAALWPALEGSLTFELWEPLDGAHKRTPYAPAQQFLWAPRATRLAAIARSLAAHGGGLTVVVLPSMHLTLRPDANTPSSFWRAWAEEPSVATLGSATVLDATGAFREPMADLAAVLRSRGFDQGPDGQDRIAPDTPFAEQSQFLLDDTGHYGVAGHRRLARLVCEHLVAGGFLEPRD